MFVVDRSPGLLPQEAPVMISKRSFVFSFLADWLPQAALLGMLHSCSRVLAASKVFGMC